MRPLHHMWPLTPPQLAYACENDNNSGALTGCSGSHNSVDVQFAPCTVGMCLTHSSTLGFVGMSALDLMNSSLPTRLPFLSILFTRHQLDTHRAFCIHVHCALFHSIQSSCILRSSLQCSEIFYLQFYQYTDPARFSVSWIAVHKKQIAERIQCVICNIIIIITRQSRK